MGFLHDGHLSLVRQARKDNDAVVVSIFVNPLQFGPKEDFKEYPRDLKRDAKLLSGLCDFLFVPPASEFMPGDFCSRVEVKGLSDVLCGFSRKGHFVGVTTVVAKLFNIVGADRAYFGRKDAQQALIIEKMIADLNFGTVAHILPIVREKDGLAMSSRNATLTPKERSEAVVLYQALKSAERMAEAGLRDTSKIRRTLIDFIGRTASARVDYVQIVDPKTLEPLKQIEKEALLLLAVVIGSTRLIDNTKLKIKNER
jgi:pantoate--beta-alanine ligase